MEGKSIGSTACRRQGINRSILRPGWETEPSWVMHDTAKCNKIS